MAPPDNVRSHRDVPPGYEEFLAYVRSVKTRSVIDDPNDHDIPPAIRCWGTVPFDWEIVALCPQINRDMALWAASVIGGLVGCDGVTMVSDAITTKDTLAPEEADRLTRGSLTGRWNQGERDGLTECLMFHTTWLDGRNRAETSRYEVNDGVLRWTNSDRDIMDSATLGEGMSLGGTIPEVLLQVITERPPLLVAITETFEGLGLPPEKGWVHRTRAALMLLQREGIVCMVGGSNEVLRELGSLPGAHEVDLSGGDPLERLLRD